MELISPGRKHCFLQSVEYGGDVGKCIEVSGAGVCIQIYISLVYQMCVVPKKKCEAKGKNTQCLQPHTLLLMRLRYHTIVPENFLHTIQKGRASRLP